MKLKKSKKASNKPLYITAVVLTVAAMAFSAFYGIKILADGIPTLNISQTVDNNNPKTGQNFTYTINYSNPSTTSDVYNATITDVLPANLRYVSADYPSDVTGPPVVTGNTVTFTFKTTLEAGKTGVIKLTAKFPEGVTPADGTSNAAKNQPYTTASNVKDNPLLWNTSNSNSVTVTPRPNDNTWHISKSLYIPSSVLPALDNPVTYAITVTAPPVLGGLNLNNIVVNDTLPTNNDITPQKAVFVSATDSYSYDAGTGVVTWNISSLNVGATKTVYVTVEYPSLYFAKDTDVINNVLADASLYGGGTANEVTASCTHHFTDAVASVAQFTKTTRQSDERYANEQTADYFIGSIQNTGNEPLDKIMISDAIPSQIKLTQITTGSFSSGCSVEVMYQTNLNSDWQKFLSSPYTSPSNGSLNVSDLPLDTGDGEYVTNVEWIVTNASGGGLPSGFVNTSNIRISGVVHGTVNTSFTNTATMDAYKGLNEIPNLPISASKLIKIIDQEGWLSPSLTVNGSTSVNYGDTVTFNMRVANNAYATGSLTDPVGILTLPSQFDASSLAVTGWDKGNLSATPDAPVQTVDNTSGKVISVFNNLTLAPGQYVDVQVSAQIKDLTPVGYTGNVNMYMTTKNNSDVYENAPSLSADINDLDGDSSTTDLLANSNCNVFVKFKGSLSSTCYIKDINNSDYVLSTDPRSYYPGYVTTVAGGVVKYKLTVSNTDSNGSIGNVVIIDKLPEVGDTGVVDTSSRGSSWTPYLVNQITGLNGAALPAGVTVYYSTNLNPSCEELSDPANKHGQTSDGWSTTPPADITTVHSLKFVLDPSMTIAVGDSLTIEWPMRAPVGAPLNLVAWNSFGYGATYMDASTDGQSTIKQSFLPSEPKKVGYSIASPTYPAIGDYVFDDKNKDGIQEAGETGINGVLVNLYQKSGDTYTLVGFTRTGDDNSGSPGHYLFPNLQDGTYKVEFIYPKTYTDPTDPNYTTAYYLSPQHSSGSTDANDSDADLTTLNKDTLPDPALINPDGTYKDNGTNKNIVLTDDIVFNESSGNNLNVDCGLYELCSLKGTAWYDKNANGILDTGETTKLSDVTVTLFESDGLTRAKEHDGITDIPSVNTGLDDGTYEFDNLEPGDYKVKFTTKDGYAFSPQGTNSYGDATGLTDTLTLLGGDRRTGVDEGEHLGSIGNLIFNDSNADGIYNADDTGFAGITVKLVDSNGSMLKDAFNNDLTTVTASDGSYCFDNLLPGDYYLQVLKPADTSTSYYSFSPEKNAAAPLYTDGDSNVDQSTGKTNTITLAAGVRTTNVDAGIYKLCSVGNFAWDDINANGIQDAGEHGIAGITVNLLDANNSDSVIQTTTTDANGHYVFYHVELGDYKVSFENPYNTTLGEYEYMFSPSNVGSDNTDSDGTFSSNNDPEATTAQFSLSLTGMDKTDIDQGMYAGQIGNFVFLDNNDNGVKDAGETTGINGVTVNLLNASDSSVAATTTTSNGSYLFDTVLPGSYIIQFVKPTGYDRFSGSGSTTINTDNDSDVAPATGETTTVTITPGQRTNDIDAGLYKICSIGDFVWNDYDSDGNQDNGEPGIGGVAVTLKNSLDVTVATTTTNSNGNYSFTNLDPGTYSVIIDKPSAQAGSLQFSPYKGGGSQSTSGDSATITNIVLTSGSVNNTIDQGMHAAQIGDYVWHDVDADGIQDGGEPGIANATVELFNSSDNSEVTSIFGKAELTTTDANGHYYFNDLPAGTYYVGFSLPTGCDHASQQYATTNSADSNISIAPSNGLYKTDDVSLETGGQDLTMDAGFYKSAVIGDYVWHDKNGDGLQNDGAANVDGIAGVTVTLYNSNGTTRATDADGNSVADALTDSNGHYSFSDIKPGASYVVGFSNPTDYKPALKTQGANRTIDSDIDRSTLKTASIAITSIIGTNTYYDASDAGFFIPVTISGKAWEDTDGNGTQNDAINISGVSVVLLDKSGGAANDADGNAVPTNIKSGDDGSYTFTNLRPDTYIVAFSMPSGYTNVTAKNATGNSSNNNTDTLDSDINTAINGIRYRSDNITVSSGINVGYLDAGFYNAVSIGDLVWNDLNANGIQDGGETGVNVAGATVTLKKSDGSTAATYSSGATVPAATVNSSGIYSFTNLSPGSYRLLFSLPSGYAGASPKDNAGDDTKDSDIDTTTRMTGVVTLTSGQSTNDIDAGFYMAASIGNFVWNDLNANGVQDSGEPGILNAAVTLKNSLGATVATTNTISGGIYSFNNLVPGNYTVVFAEPSGYVKASAKGVGSDPAKQSDIDPVSLSGDSVTLISGQTYNNVDAGFYKPAALTDRVWDDLDADGIQDSGEPSIQGISITLLDQSSQSVKDISGSDVTAKTTDTNGLVTFSNLTPGKYIVCVDKPSSYKVSPIDASGSTELTDSDIDAATYKTAQITLNSGDNISGYDAGLYGATTITGIAWQDSNADGHQDDGEPVISDATVNLTDSAGNSVNDANGNHVGQTKTSSSGSYIFSNLVPGSYKVVFDLPSGMTSVSLKNQGDDTADSDIDTVSRTTDTLTLTSGETLQHVDAGFYKTASIGDYVFEDVNGNGIQDDGDKPITGSSVTLLDKNGNAVDTTSTDSNGKYSFSSLTPGDYSVQFDKPDDMTGCAEHAGNDNTVDSDINASRETVKYTLTSGENLTTVDAGFYNSVQIGGIAWHDPDGNGIQDNAESYLNGVTFTLFDANGNQAHDAFGSEVAAVTTDTTVNNGAYLFDNLAPGTYTVKVTLQNGYSLSPQGKGDDRSKDSDFSPATMSTSGVTLYSGDPLATFDAGAYMPASISGTIWNDQNDNFTIDSGEAGMQDYEVDLFSGDTQAATTYTGADGSYSFGGLLEGDYTVKIKLPKGRVETFEQEPNMLLDCSIAANLTEGQNDTTVNFGIFKLPTATIGNTVWDDANANGILDDGEKGISGISVGLFNQGDNLVATVTTDTNGGYLFDGLDAGTYYVKILKMGGYDKVSKQDVTPNTDGNCDFDQNGKSCSVTVDYGQDDLTIDAALYKLASINNTVWLDSDKDGVIDNGEKGLPGVTVTIFDINKVPLASTITDQNGNYHFDGLIPGVYSIMVTKADNLTFDPQALGGVTGQITLSSGQLSHDADVGLFSSSNPITGDRTSDMTWMFLTFIAVFGLFTTRRIILRRNLKK